MYFEVGEGGVGGGGGVHLGRSDRYSLTGGPAKEGRGRGGGRVEAITKAQETG